MAARVVISGGTVVAAVIGHPVRHSLSPVIHNAAFAAAGLDWTFAAFDVAPGDVPRALDGMRALGLGGMSVTMPHKSDVAAAVDERSPVAEQLGAVNCVVPLADGRLRGENTDGLGFVRSLADADVEVADRRCVVVGAGGAARAIVLALAGAGAAEIVVANRTPARAVEAAGLGGSVGRVGPLEAVEAADLVVNATSVGMGDGAGLPLDATRLRAGQVVADLVYQPVRTPLLEAAAARGCVVVDGLGMLVHQAALAFELWTGETAPVREMHRAVAAELRKRSDAGSD